jgi:hypothetical protein
MNLEGIGFPRKGKRFFVSGTTPEFDGSVPQIQGNYQTAPEGLSIYTWDEWGAAV